MDHVLLLGFHGMRRGVIYPLGVMEAPTLISSRLEDSPAERWPIYERKLS